MATAIAAASAIVASVACIGGRAGYRVGYLRHRDTGPYYGLYSHLLLPDDADEPTLLLGGELAVIESMRAGREYSLSAAGAPAGVLVLDEGVLMPTLQLGLQFGHGVSVLAAACYGAYGLHLQAFACGRWSTAGWLGADINLGTNAVEALNSYAFHRLRH